MTLLYLSNICYVKHSHTLIMGQRQFKQILMKNSNQPPSKKILIYFLTNPDVIYSGTWWNPQEQLRKYLLRET